MISLLLVDKKEKESAEIEKTLKGIAARLTDEKWLFTNTKSVGEIENYLADRPSIQFCYYDMEVDETLNFAASMRKNYSEMMLMLIVDGSVSPYKYLKPGIRPDSLLLRPFQEDDLKNLSEDFISSGLTRIKSEDNSKFFLIENKEENVYLDYNNIFYFEARDKKIYARTLKEEYAFYKSMDELSGELPEEFVRCHRSYLVNVRKIRKIQVTDNLLELEQNLLIPVSRSYKTIIKNRMRNEWAR